MQRDFRGNRNIPFEWPKWAAGWPERGILAAFGVDV